MVADIDDGKCEDTIAEAPTEWRFSYKEANLFSTLLRVYGFYAKRFKIRATVRQAALRLSSSDAADNNANVEPPEKKTCSTSNISEQLYGFDFHESQSHIDQELEEFEMLVVHKLVDAREFWAARETSYPQLSRLALLYLCAQPALSSASALSLLTIVDYQRRSRLTSTEMTAVLRARDHLLQKQADSSANVQKAKLSK